MDAGILPGFLCTAELLYAPDRLGMGNMMEPHTTCMLGFLFGKSWTERWEALNSRNSWQKLGKISKII